MVNDQGIIMTVEDFPIDTITTSAIMKANAPGSVVVSDAPKLTTTVKGLPVVDMYPDGMSLYNQTLSTSAGYQPSKIQAIEQGSFTLGGPLGVPVKASYTRINDVIVLTMQGWTIGANQLAGGLSGLLVGTLPTKIQPIGFFQVPVAMSCKGSDGNTYSLGTMTLSINQPGVLIFGFNTHGVTFDPTVAVTVSQTTFQYFLNTSY